MVLVPMIELPVDVNVVPPSISALPTAYLPSFIYQIDNFRSLRGPPETTKVVHSSIVSCALQHRDCRCIRVLLKTRNFTHNPWMERKIKVFGLRLLIGQAKTSRDIPGSVFTIDDDRLRYGSSVFSSRHSTNYTIMGIARYSGQSTQLHSHCTENLQGDKRLSYSDRSFE